MHRATAELKATGLENRALKIGNRAPEFTLFNQDHAQVNSADLLHQGTLVVSFLRGHWLTDAPISQPVQARKTGRIVKIPQVGGLHHRYERVAA